MSRPGELDPVVGPGLVTEVVTIDGLEVRLLDVGPTEDERGLPLLVIPGHTARIEGFVEMMPTLARHHRVLVADLPGSGESEKPDRRYDLGFYEDVLLEILDRRGVDQAIPVGGSLGGNLVLRLGHRSPLRFPRLVLWAPGGAWTARPWLAALIRAVCGRRLFWPSVRIQSRFWYAEDEPRREEALAETFAYYRRVVSPGFVAMYWGIAADQIAQSLFPIAPEILQPTLLMWGDQDHGAGMGRGVARLSALLPDCTFLVLPGRRHSLELEAPEDLAAAIVAFTSVPPTP